jgi:hypothetical protein
VLQPAADRTAPTVEITASTQKGAESAMVMRDVLVVVVLVVLVAVVASAVCANQVVTVVMAGPARTLLLDQATNNDDAQGTSIPRNHDKTTQCERGCERHLLFT